MGFGARTLIGFVSFKKRMSLNGVKDAIDDQKAHVEIARGSVRDNVAYCSKSEGRLDGPFEFGTPPAGQGHRTDLDEAAELASRGRFTDIRPAVYVRHWKGLHALRALVNLPRERELKVSCYYGGAGVGKSRRARAEAPDAYWKPSGEWWDGYAGEHTVILDDFHPSSQAVQSVLRWLDRYPLRVPVKGGFVSAEWDTVIITTNIHPESWYPGWHEQILRRITHLECLDPIGPPSGGVHFDPLQPI